MYLSQYIQAFPCVLSSIILAGKSLFLISAVSCLQTLRESTCGSSWLCLCGLPTLHMSNVWDSHDPGCCVPILPRRCADTCCVSLSGSHGTPADAEQSACGYLCVYRDVGTQLGEADCCQYLIFNSWKCLSGLVLTILSNNSKILTDPLGGPLPYAYCNAPLIFLLQGNAIAMAEGEAGHILRKPYIRAAWGPSTHGWELMMTLSNIYSVDLYVG
jgi:hypothetical protein